MNSIDVNSVLAQIRALSAQAAGKPVTPPLAPAAAPAATSGTSFGSALKSALDGVNAAQSSADRLQRAFETGDPNTDLASVMLATSKAQVSFKAAVEVRNRMVTAYQDIMNMPL